MLPGEWEISSVIFRYTDSHLIHLRFAFYGLFLDDKISGLEETISTGDMKFRLFLYYSQWSSKHV